MQIKANAEADKKRKEEVVYIRNEVFETKLSLRLKKTIKETEGKGPLSCRT